MLNIKVRKLGVKLAIFWLQCVMLLTFMVTGYSYLSIFLTYNVLYQIACIDILFKAFEQKILGFFTLLILAVSNIKGNTYVRLVWTHFWTKLLHSKKNIEYQKHIFFVVTWLSDQKWFSKSFFFVKSQFNYFENSTKPVT